MISHRWWRLAAYLFVVAMGTFGHWRLMVQADAIEHEAETREAEGCVNAWVSREDVRDMAEAGYRRNAETLVALSTNAAPDRVAAYQLQVEDDVAEIRRILPDPECDLYAAHRALNGP